LISAAELHHARDRKYEVGLGMQEKGRVGRLDEGTRGVIEAFVEGSKGEREERLRKEVEGDVGVGQTGWNKDGIVDADGKIIMLHKHDRRAIEFRERLRTW
jgi:hypothetical protein